MSSASKPLPPSLTVTNQEFLRALFGNSWHRTHVTSFEGDPGDPDLDRGCWAGGAAGHWRIEPGHNNYYTVALFTGPRRKEHFEQLVVLGVDDVGPKVDPAKVRALLGEPTYRIETSPGNEQWGYRLDPPITSEPVATALIEALIKHLVGGAPDPGMAGVTRYLRMPVGTNQKAGLDKFECRLLELDRNRWLGDANQVAIANILGVDLSGVSPVSPGFTQPPPGFTHRFDTLAEHDVLFQAMRRLGLVLHGPRNSSMGRTWDVTCPWSEEHTGRATSGTAYNPTLHRFECHHGHCRARTAEHLGERLDTLLREDSGGLSGLVDVEWPDLPADMSSPSAGSTGPARGTSNRGADIAGADPTEDGLALAFVKRYRDRVLFNRTTGKWHAWDGSVWTQDGTHLAFTWARQVTRDFRYAQDRDVRALSKINAAAAINKGASMDPDVSRTSEEFDGDAHRAGAPGGEVDLGGGSVSPPEPAHMITRRLLVAPAPPGTRAPIWEDFLWETFGGDTDLIDFVHQWFGYCLSGDTSAEVFAFLYGTGGNGKGVLLHTVSAIAHDYAHTVDSAMLMQRAHVGHETEIAQLAGRRLVTTTEIKDGARFDLVRVKQLASQEGKMGARFMRRDHFQFVPTHKLTLVGNHQPAIDHVDEAIRRRLLLIPFLHRPKVVDATLKDRLVPEYPAILRKLITGCGEVYRALRAGQSFHTLVPGAVSAASQSYLVEQDPIAQWLTECCVYDITARTLTVSQAFTAHQTWCAEESRQITASIRTFGDDLARASETLGWNVVVQKLRTGVTVCGVTLRV